MPGRYFIPPADVFETDDALTVILEMPGVEKNDLSIALEDDTLRVEGKIDFSKYQGMEPVYTEYIVGHYARGFTLSGKIDRDGITAQLDDGVLSAETTESKRGDAEAYRYQLKYWCPGLAPTSTACSGTSTRLLRGDEVVRRCEA